MYRLDGIQHINLNGVPTALKEIRARCALFGLISIRAADFFSKKGALKIAKVARLDPQSIEIRTVGPSISGSNEFCEEVCENRQFFRLA